MDRRSLLKLFGVGALAAPVVNGLVDTQSIVRIVEPPKVEPVASLGPWDQLPNWGEPAEMTVIFRQRDKVCQIHCRAVEFRDVHAEASLIDVTRHSNPYHDYLRGDFEFTISGASFNPPIPRNREAIDIAEVKLWP